MALTYQPPFTQVPNVGVVTLTAANAARDGSGTVSTAFTAGADGAFVKRIKFIPAQTAAAATTAKVACVFLSFNGGTNWHFYDEVALPTVTPSGTATGLTGTKIFPFPDGLVLPAGALVGVTITAYTGVQDRTQVTVEGSNY